MKKVRRIIYFLISLLSFLFYMSCSFGGDLDTWREKADKASTPFITINTQPAVTTNVTAGSISGNLSVSASVTLGASLSYQWYSNTTNSNTGGSLISGATNASFPIPTTPTRTTIYFCEVSASGGATSVRSHPAMVLVSFTSPSAAAIEMISIPAGTFQMGSPTSEPGRNSDETQHTVTLTGFSIGKYQVTQGQYKAVMDGTNPSYFKTPVSGETSTDNRPVEQVSWYDALVFCNKLSELEGLTPTYSIGGSTNTTAWGTVPTSSNNTTWDAAIVVSGSTGYRLPTEAQWEYACRAGTTSAFNWGTNTISSSQANYAATNTSDPYYQGGGAYLQRTTSVGNYAANLWGLYDMHGNVWEWCWDWYSSSYYTEAGSGGPDPAGAVSGGNCVLRGGSWDDYGRYLRSAYRGSSSPSDWRDGDSGYGFRVVLP